MKTNKFSIMKIHLGVFLFGLSGIFGKLLTFPSMIIVLGRVFFSSIFLLLVMLYLKKDLKLKHQKDYKYFALMGVILAIHWFTFFESIQESSVAIGLLTFSTFPIFVTFIDPYFSKETIKLSDIVSAGVSFLGIVLIIPKFELGNNYTQGVLFGIVSGFLYAILSILNRKYVKVYSSLVISFYEQLVATIVLLPYLIWLKPIFQTRDILLLFLLGTLFTGVSHSLFINGLKHIKTRTASIISCLEPVYGIIFAAILLNEIPSLKEIFGGIIILSTVVYSTIKVK